MIENVEVRNRKAEVADARVIKAEVRKRPFVKLRVTKAEIADARVIEAEVRNRKAEVAWCK